MKTTNNVQKSILKAGVLLSGLFFFNLSANAQGLWDKYLSGNNAKEVAIAMAENNAGQTETLKPAQKSTTAVFAEFLAETKEAALEFESWMSGNFSLFINCHTATETEKPLGMESWMADKIYFRNIAGMPDATETELRLESWMVNNKNWK